MKGDTALLLGKGRGMKSSISIVTCTHSYMQAGNQAKKKMQAVKEGKVSELTSTASV